MPETTYPAEVVALEALTGHLSRKGVGPSATRQLVEAMCDALSAASALHKANPAGAEDACGRIAGYLHSIANATWEGPAEWIEVDPVVENPTTCGLAEDCVLAFGHDGDHDFGEEE